jgi:hypothetical protein
MAKAFCCDEDAYALLDLKRHYPHKDAKELVEIAKEVLPTGAAYAAASLRTMGNCGYLTNIPVSAVTRAVQIDWSANPELAHGALEPVISPQNYKLFGGAYRRLTRWLFDEPLSEPVPEEGPLSFLLRLPSSRHGICSLRMPLRQ